MKKVIMMVVFNFVILMGGSLFACGYDGASRCGRSSNSCAPAPSSCESTVDDSCSCVDPSCNWTWENNCISRSTCCEAFGNIAGGFN